MTTDVLERFSPATREWFRGTFTTPTPAQAGAWEAISSGRHALVVAPTGSGKTLSAFLWALDRLASDGLPEDRSRRCRVLYVSPMKALAVDVERNLRSPLVGIRHAATRLGLPEPDITVAVRSGDTPPDQRRAFARTPTDVLITTPESLFLLLTSAARDSLLGVETVIIDEIHALAGTKRGAHLALSLERLDALLPRPAQRVGLSATVRPVDEVARFLAGGRPVDVVAPPSRKEWDLSVVVPVADMTELGEPTGDLSGPAAGPEPRTSIWPHVEERIVDLVAQHRSTLVFANSRRLAERLTTRLNEIWDERGETRDETDSQDRPALLARAHHGSVSKEQRAEIEEALKAGRLPAVVATSSLELGIDMGAVDLVVQVESPPSVASGLQRVGRAGHQVGAVSRGVLFPKFRSDLVQTAVVVERMRAGQIEALRVPANPLDVLAQQIVAMCALDDWTVEQVHDLARRAAPYTTLTRAVLESVLDMLAGRYPSDEFAELRPRLVWDRLSDTLTGRRGAQRLAVTSGGTIPDRGLYAVFLASGDGPGRRVGELDEEMVYESRVGDLFTLGTSTWRIEDITHDRVLVSPAPGLPGKPPFWKGDTLGRPVELGRAVGAFVREVVGLSAARARDRVAASGLDEWASDNVLAHLAEQRQATGVVPDDRTIVVERFRDELGDWRVAIHSPFGAPVHAPWALAVAARMRARFGVDVQTMHGDDGIVLRLPDIELDDLLDSPVTGGRTSGRAVGAEVLDAITLDPDEVAPLVTEEIGGSALFAARFRECAARALLLPRRRPDRRQPLWQQRQRAAQLLEVAAQYPTFPIVLEAVRECVQDVFDVPALTELMRAIGSREVRLVDVETPRPSPFASSLLFGYVAQFLYEGDSPLAERRAAALSLDPGLLAELLGTSEGLALRDLLDAAAIAHTEAELQRLAPERRARDGDEVSDLLRALGPLTTAQVLERCADPAAAPAWLAGLEEARRAIRVRIGGEEQWAAVEDAARLRDALGVGLPVGLPQAFLEPVTDPVGDLVARHARTHGPFRACDVADRLGLGVAVVQGALARLAGSGRVVQGQFLPDGGESSEHCDADVLRMLRRRSLASLRAEVEPVPPDAWARFLPAWQGLGGGLGERLRGRDGLLRAVEQLSGAVLPASAVEALVLPARVAGYTPGLLDEVMTSGEVLWQGHGALAGDDAWVSLHLAETAHLTLTPPTPPDGEAADRILARLAGNAAWRFRDLSDAVATPRPGASTAPTEPQSPTDDRLGDTEVHDALWELVWAGLVSGDTFAPMRARLAGGRTTHRRSRPAALATRYGRRRSLGGLRGLGPLGVQGGEGGPGGPAGRAGGPARPALPTLPGPATAVGRWSLLPEAETDPTTCAYAAAELLLDRYGVLTRGSATAEEVPGGFAAVHRVLTAAEEAGRVRRGYFVETLGGSQFATTGAVDRLRSMSRAPGEAAKSGEPAMVLAAGDPANPFGASLPWPPRKASVPAAAPHTAASEGSADAGARSSDASRGHQPGRKAGAVVVLHDGRLVLYVERGGRTLLSWLDDPATLQAAAGALALAVREGALGRLTVERADGGAVLGARSPLTAALEAAGFHATPRGLRIRR